MKSTILASNMSAKRSFFRKGDLLLYAFIIALGTLILLWFGKDKGTVVTVSQHGKTIYTFDLADEALDGKEFLINGEYQNTLLVKDGELYVSSSTCPDRICQQSMPLTAKGGVICCVPNGVIITAGSKNAEWDVVVR